MSIDTVNDLPPRVQYVASAAQTNFDYPFPIFADADLVVDVDGVTKTLTTDYTVAGEGSDTGGTVTLLSAMSGNEIVTIYRDMAIERSTDFAQNGPLSSTSFNDELDKITLILQQLEGRIGRTVRFPMAAEVADSALELSPLSAYLSKYLYVSANGELEPASAIAATTLSQSVIAALLFPQTTLEATASITPSALQRLPDNGYDVRRTGVVGNGVADDTNALRNACKAAGPWARVYVDSSLNCVVSGKIVDSTLAAYAVGQTWYGGGKITAAPGIDYDVFDVNGITDFTVTGLRGEASTLGDTYTEPTGYSDPSFTARFFTARNGAHRSQMFDCYIVGFQSAARIGTGSVSAGCRVENNDIVNPDAWGVNVQTDADDCIVTMNRISGVAHEHGVYVSGTSGNNIKNPTITENVVTDCDNDGIKLTYCDDATVADNHSYANGGSGIYATVGVNRPDIHDNHTWENGTAGIQVYDGTSTTDRVRIHHNTSRKNQHDGILVNSAPPGAVSRTWIDANDVEDNDQAVASTYGITVAGATTTTKTLITENRVTDETVGIRTASGVDAVVMRNRFENCTTNISDSSTTPVLQEGSYTGTLTGCTTSPTGTIEYSVNGDQVTLEIPAISATSNTTAATVTGMPAGIRPAAAQTVVGITTDNGTTAFGKITVETSGVLTLHVAQSATFTNSGTKAIAACSITYRLT